MATHKRKFGKRSRTRRRRTYKRKNRRYMGGAPGQFVSLSELQPGQQYFFQKRACPSGNICKYIGTLKKKQSYLPERNSIASMDEDALRMNILTFTNVMRISPGNIREPVSHTKSGNFVIHSQGRYNNDWIFFIPTDIFPKLTNKIIYKNTGHLYDPTFPVAEDFGSYSAEDISRIEESKQQRDENEMMIRMDYKV